MNASAEAADFSWATIPTDLLAAELRRRHGGSSSAETEQPRPQCGGKEPGHYDTALHVFALILILALSTLSCAFPLLSSRSRSGSRKQSRVIFICQHFGTGVLIATAFVHLLPTAFLSLTDPCLPYIFSKGYTAFAGVIAMVSALVVVSLESYLTTRGSSHHHHHHWDEDDEEDAEGLDDHKIYNQGANGGPSEGSGLAARRGSNHHRPADIALGDMSDTQGLMAGVSPLPESTPTKITLTKDPQGNGSGSSPRDSEDSQESLDLELNLHELDPVPEVDQPLPTRRRATPSTGGPTTPTPSPEEQKRLLLQCLLLEAGILFHSVFIGMALSVATGPAFVVFLVAISFHQSFEGLALGSRIAALHFPRSSFRPWLMVLAYGTTTPFGQAIGLLVHNMYDPASQTGLLMVGIMNGVSAGLLLFAGLVQLLAEDFLSEKSYRVLTGRRRVHAFLSVFGGAALMAIVGAFA